MRSPAAVVLILALSAGCGQRTRSETPNDPPGPSEPAPGDVTLSGGERLGWTQELSGSDARTFGFVAYVDGARAVLGNVTCTGSPASCSASLPPMSPGRHILHLAAVRQIGAGYVESDRSPALLVTLLAGRTSNAQPGGVAQASSAAAPASAATAGHAVPSVDVVTRDVRDVTDLAAASNGDLFVAERRGTIRILRAGGFLTDPALTLADAVRDSGDLSLLSVALSAEFEENRRVYFLYTAPAAEGVMYHLASGREVGGRIGEIATLVSIGPAPAGAGIVRVASDGTLNVAAANRIYRVNADGTTPADSRARDGVIAALSGVSGLGVGGEANNLYALAASPSARVLARIAPRHDARVDEPVYAWQPEERPVTMTWYGRTAIAAFAGRMLIGTAGGTLQAIDVSPPPRSPIEIALGDVGRVTAIAVDPSGSVFVAASREDRVQPPRVEADTHLGDVILRLQPREGGK